MKLIRKIKDKIIFFRAKKSSSNYIRFLRRQGVKVGDNTKFYSPATTYVDITRPHLIKIGSNVRITRGVSLLTHGADWHILRNVFRDPFICGSAGKTVIEDNVFIGINSIVLKGCVIGKNSIIGAGSVVTKSIPKSSVAAGNPARVIMDLNSYYYKRKKVIIDEAKEDANEYWQNFHRLPEKKNFKEFFPLFLERNEKEFDELPVEYQMGDILEEFMKTEPIYETFEDFLRASNVIE